MFERLLQKLKELAWGREAVDPARFDDPVAQQTDWGPLKPGGANFCTQKLVRVDPDRLEFHAAWGAVLVGLFFLLVGLAALAFFVAGTLFGWTAASSGDKSVLWIPALFGSLFSAAGGGMLYGFTLPVVFDRRRGYFWKGRRAPSQLLGRGAAERVTDLARIHALQLIAELCHGSKGSSYYSYELNLVLEDGSRVNVVDHGNLERLRQDAQALAEFLGRPLWDAA